MVTTKLLFARKTAEIAQTTQYTTPAGTRTIIDKFTVTNATPAVADLSVNIVPSGGAASTANVIIAVRAIGPGETYTCPEMVGQVMEAGSFISTLASIVTTLTLSVCGREIV
jgi:hypothetical protein